jgi:hypothetical protein
MKSPIHSLCLSFILIAVVDASDANKSLEDGFGNQLLLVVAQRQCTKEAVTCDLVETKAKGFIGALIVDAGGADQRGNALVPALCLPQGH